MIPAERLAEMIASPDPAVRMQAVELLSCWGTVPPGVVTVLRWVGAPGMTLPDDEAGQEAFFDLWLDDRNGRLGYKLGCVLEKISSAWSSHEAGRPYSYDRQEGIRHLNAAIRELKSIGTRPIGFHLLHASLRQHLTAARNAGSQVTVIPEVCDFLTQTLPLEPREANLAAARWLLAHVSAQDSAGATP